MTLTSRGSTGPFRVVPFRPERNATLDTLRWAKKSHQIPVLVEVDVTAARGAIRAYREESGRSLSFTGWVVSCVARAAAEHPSVHGLRQGRRRIVLFEEVDVAVLIERVIGVERETLPMPVVIRHAHAKSPLEIHGELRAAQEVEVDVGSSSIADPTPGWLQAVFFRLPWWLRDALLWRWLLRDPHRMKRTMGTVVVTSAGMAAPGLLSWGVPSAVHPLAVAVGGIAERASAGGVTEVLALTVVFDHAVTDGAPVARFVGRLSELLTGAHGLPGPGSEPAGTGPG